MTAVLLQRSPLPARRRRHRHLLVPALGVVVVLVAAALLLGRGGAPAPPAAACVVQTASPVAPGVVTRLTAGATPVRDGRGGIWTPDRGLLGGKEVQSQAAVVGTASPQVYLSQRRGAESWTVRVSHPGRYAVDLLTGDFSGNGPARDVFDVTADGGGPEVLLVHDLDLGVMGVAGHAHHVAGFVAVTDGRIVLRMRASRGSSLVSGLAITYDPSATAGKTLLHSSFDGPAGAAPGGAWAASTDTPGGSELERYTGGTANAALDGDGHLVITARPDTKDAPLGGWTSAKLTTENRLTVQYGHVQARIKVPAGQGLFPAFWALGSNKPVVDWPHSGEFDVMENLGSHSHMAAGFVHGYGDARDGRGWRDQPVYGLGRSHDDPAAVTDVWRTFAADLQPGAITFSVDGVPFFTAAVEDLRPGQEWAFDQPYYLLLNLAVGGSWGGPPDATTPRAASLLIDDVLVTG